MTSNLASLDPLLRELLLQHAKEDIAKSRKITDLERAAAYLRSTICENQRDSPSEYVTMIDEPPGNEQTRTVCGFDNDARQSISHIPSVDTFVEGERKQDAPIVSSWPPCSPSSPVDDLIDDGTQESSFASEASAHLQADRVCLPLPQFLSTVFCINTFASILSRNRSLKVLCDAFPATNGWREWSEVVPTDIQSFCEHCIPFVQATRTQVALRCRLTGSTEDFLRDILGVQCMLFGTPWSSGLPQYAAATAQCMFFDGMADATFAMSGHIETFFLRSDVAPFSACAEIEKHLNEDKFWFMHFTQPVQQSRVERLFPKMGHARQRSPVWRTVQNKGQGL